MNNGTSYLFLAMGCGGGRAAAHWAFSCALEDGGAQRGQNTLVDINVITDHCNDENVANKPNGEYDAKSHRHKDTRQPEIIVLQYCNSSYILYKNT
jgi:hypothetical protein